MIQEGKDSESIWLYRPANQGSIERLKGFQGQILGTLTKGIIHKSLVIVENIEQNYGSSFEIFLAINQNEFGMNRYKVWEILNFITGTLDLYCRES